MISPAFLLRVAAFIVSLAVAVGCVLAVWFAMTYALRLMVDALAKNNHSFAVWLRGKWPFSAMLRKKGKQ